MYKRNVYGTGYNSGGTYEIMSSPNVKSKAYSVWRDMLRRGYSENYKSKRETYRDVTVCEEWHDFQVFAKWFYQSYIEDYQLDKDMMKKDNKVYCPEYCRFIPKDLNSIVVNRVGKSRNYELPLGVSRNGHKNKPYTAWCNNGEGKTVNLGSYETVAAAREVYVKYKKDLITTKAKDYFILGAIGEDLYNILLKWEVD